jgi:hypothetical protein
MVQGGSSKSVVPPSQPPSTKVDFFPFSFFLFHPTRIHSQSKISIQVLQCMSLKAMKMTRNKHKATDKYLGVANKHIYNIEMHAFIFKPFRNVADHLHELRTWT